MSEYESLGNVLIKQLSKLYMIQIAIVNITCFAIIVFVHMHALVFAVASCAGFIALLHFRDYIMPFMKQYLTTREIPYDDMFLKKIGGNRAFRNPMLKYRYLFVDRIA